MTGTDIVAGTAGVDCCTERVAGAAAGIGTVVDGISHQSSTDLVDETDWERDPVEL